MIINIQRSRTPFVFEMCLIPLQSVLNTDSDESWHTFCAHLLNVCLCLPLHTPRSLHSRGQFPNARSLSVNFVAFLFNVFSVFFQWMRSSNVYCWRSSCLDLGTTQVIIPQLISDPVSNTHQISIWSPPTMHSDVAEHVESCLSCQYRKTSHRSPTLPTGHRPVTKPFQVVAVDLVEYKSKSGGNRFILSVIDHLTRFLILIPMKSKEVAVVVRHLIDRVFSVFGPPETLHSD